MDVSVVVPTRNRSALLPVTLRSVLAQRDVDVEVIVVDGASTDDTPAVLAALADARLRVVWQDAPDGAASARNRGAAEARGEWLAFVDDDDLWSQLKADMDEFIAGAEHELEHGGGAKRRKDFLIRKYPRGKKKLPVEPAILASDGAWLRYAAGGALLGIVNAYRGAQVKLVDFEESVNVTLGLPIVRTSPDHGTAYDIAGKGVARAVSMQRALALAIEMVARRAAYA